MSESGYNVIVEADDDRDDGTAAEVARILCEAYPGHPWHVRVGKGVIIVKHMKMSATYGMCQHYNRIAFNSKVLKRGIIGAAGEFLERFGKTRGAFVAHEWENDRAIEGVPKKHQILRVLH